MNVLIYITVESFDIFFYFLLNVVKNNWDFELDNFAWLMIANIIRTNILASNIERMVMHQ